MGEMLLRLIVLVPLVGGLAWASLWLWKRAQQGLPGGVAIDRPVSLVGTVSLGMAGRLAVVEFDGSLLLLAVSKTQISLVAQGRGSTGA